MEAFFTFRTNRELYTARTSPYSFLQELSPKGLTGAWSFRWPNQRFFGSPIDISKFVQNLRTAERDCAGAELQIRL